MTPEQEKELRRSRRAKNIAVGLALLALAVLFYLITIVKMGGNVAS